MKKLKNDKVDLNQVVALTLDQVKARYNIGANTARKIADEIGANIRLGERKRLFNRKILDEYFSEFDG